MEEKIVLVIAFIFFIMGIMFLRGKWTFLIAGINTMSEEEKRNYNIKNISKAMGKLAIFISLILAGMSFIESFRNIGGILIVGATLPTVIYINVAKKFKALK